MIRLPYIVIAALCVGCPHLAFSQASAKAAMPPAPSPPPAPAVHLFRDKISDTLHGHAVTGVVIYRFKAPDMPDSAVLQDSMAGKRCRDPQRITDLITALKDSVNYLKGGLARSCAFVPQFCLRLILAQKKGEICILYSSTCQQMAIVKKDLRQVTAFGDLNDKGSALVNHYLENN